MMTLRRRTRCCPTAAGRRRRVRIERVHSDTRTLQPGDLFVALKGERFDAHDFLPQARAAGAVAALAERGPAEAGLPGLQVATRARALRRLAAAWRARMQLALIAVTGSNGKTTVTQMIASACCASGSATRVLDAGQFQQPHRRAADLAAPAAGRRAAWHRAGVVELGMNHPGEIAQLAAMAAPTVALVNNAQREHQEFMARVEAVARENGAVIEALGAARHRGIPRRRRACAAVARWPAAADATFALRPADVTAEAAWAGEAGRPAAHAGRRRALSCGSPARTT